MNQHIRLLKNKRIEIYIFKKKINNRVKSRLIFWKRKIIYYNISFDIIKFEKLKI